MNKFYIINHHNHCNINNYQFNIILNFFNKNNYILSDNINDADLGIIISCSISNKHIININKLIITNLLYKNLKYIIIFGCFTKYQKIINNRLIYINQKDLYKFDLYFKNIVSINSCDNFINKKDKNVINILISQGCNHNCSYCNIKLIKGCIKSKKYKVIINQIKLSNKSGYNNFFILSDDFGSYGIDLYKSYNILNLLKDIFRINKNIKLYINNFYPSDFIKYYPLLKEYIKSKKIIYLSIPIQSGSKNILKLMNRNYNIKKLSFILKELKILNPKIKLYTDIIINFPNETITDFNKSITISKLFDEVNFNNYSDIINTKSYNLYPKVSLKDKNFKIKHLKSLGIKIN